MQEISEQYFRKDCGTAARNIFPNNHTSRILSTPLQAEFSTEGDEHVC